MSVASMIARLALVAVPWLVATTAAAAAPVGDVRVGFGGVYRTGSWTPLVVEFAEGSPAPWGVCVWVEDPDGQYVRSPAALVEQSPGRPRQARLTVRFGRPSGRVLVEAIESETAERATDRSTLPVVVLPPPLPATENVLLVIGDLPAADRSSRLLAGEDGTRPRVVAVGGADSAAGAGEGGRLIGRSARDFAGADAIIVCGRSAADLDSDALVGIDAWVRQGGRLVLLAGESAVDLGRSGTPAADWLPGEIDRLVPLRRGSSIEAYARASRPLDKNAFTGLSMPLLRNARAVEGVVEAFEGRGPADQPLVVRRAHGLGTIAWIGVDLDRPPFRSWSGSDSLLVELLGGRAAVKEAGRGVEPQRGSLDLLGQLRQAIDRFPGVLPIPFEVIAGLGALYVVCLYPVDWWLSTRRGGRRAGAWLSWLSLPLLVALCSGLAWGAGLRWKGAVWRTSAAELVDVDVVSRLVRSSGYAGVWSPVNATLDVAVEAARTDLAVAGADPEAAHGDDVTWFAPCGRGIGGTDAASPHPSLAMADYVYAVAAGVASGGLAGVPIAASSSRLFEADCVTSLAEPPVESTLAKEGQGTLRGGVVSRLPFPLEECVLAHAGWLYEIGRLDPGRGFDTSTGRGPRSLAGALTRRTTNRDREIATRWNQSESDPLRILEIAGFHAAAGGRGYTGLESGRLARLDLSPLLPLDRAVLVGRGPSFVAWRCRAETLGGGESTAVPPMPASSSLWRIVIPLPRPAHSSNLVPESPADDTP